MKENNIYISTNLQHLRRQKNKTQKEIGDICGKTDTAISNWEKGIREPDATDLGILANYFKITVDDLLSKDLRIKDNNTATNELDILFSKSKGILNETEIDMIKHSMQRAIDRYEDQKKNSN